MSPERPAERAAGPQRFKPYPAYRDSCVEWLGRIPTHWDCLALSRVTLSRCDGPFGSGLKSEHYAEEGVRVVRLQNIGWAKFVDADRAYIGLSYARQLGDHSVIESDVLIAGLGDEGHPVGRACVAPHGIEPAMVKADCFRFRVDARRLFPLFAAYQLSVIAHAAAGSLATGATRARVNLTTMAAQALGLPPPSEQRAIAAFLDRETARIDALVAKKERLIALLQEKRTAAIWHAVTRGLDPQVRLQPTEVAWLGSIPDHWQVHRIKHVADLESGHTPDKKVAAYWDGGDIPWVSLKDSATLRITDRIAETSEYTTPAGIANSSAHVLPAGAVVFSRDATVGLAAITTRPMAVSQHFIAWVCGPLVLSDYLLLVIRAMGQELERLSMGATISTIGMTDVGGLSTPVPPLDEQRRIVAQLGRETAKLDALAAKVREAIERLTELRTALISAAVTGQVDVRNEQPSGEAAKSQAGAPGDQADR